MKRQTSLVGRNGPFQSHIPVTLKVCVKKNMAFFARVRIYLYIYVCVYIHTQCLCRCIIINIIKAKAIMHSQTWNAVVTESWQCDLRWSHFLAFLADFSHVCRLWPVQQLLGTYGNEQHKELIDQNKPLSKQCGWEQWWEQIHLILAEVGIWCSGAGNLFSLQLAHKSHGRGIHPDCKEMLWAVS